MSDFADRTTRWKTGSQADEGSTSGTAGNGAAGGDGGAGIAGGTAADAAADTVPADGELMSRLAAGDEAALSMLYDRYSGRAFAVAYRILGDTGAAEEVVQELFLYLWHHAADYDPRRASLPTWLMLITRSRALDRIRHRRVVRRTRRDYKQERGERRAENNGYPAVLEEERGRAVRRALAGLPEEQRRVLELAYFRGLTQRRIADHLEIPLGTVKTRTSLAMKKLRRALSNEAASLL